VIWKEGQRKAVYAGAGLLALVGGAVYLKADFTAYRDGLMFWLGLVLGAHVTQQIKKPEVKP
jgi:hypothetical protein